MAIINGRSDFGKNQFVKKTSISKGTDIYTLGGDYFTIKTNLEDRNVRDLESMVGDFLPPVTLDDITVDNPKENIEVDSNSIQLNYDKGLLSNYSYFGSLKDRFQSAITNILSKFPASLYVNNIYNENVLFTIKSRVYNNRDNETTLTIPISAISNNFNLNINTNESSFLSKLTEDERIKVLELSYNLYEVTYDNNNYKLISFEKVNNDIVIKVDGEAFPDYVNGDNNIFNFHIKPNSTIFYNFINDLNDLEAYILNKDSSPKYTSTFKTIELDGNGNSLLIDKKFTWKTTDGYNLDYNSYEFKIFVESLLSLAERYDEEKSNIIVRELISTPVKEFDSEDGRVDKLLKLYGKEFDVIKKYIDGLAHLATITYDKKDNIPDRLVKNFARTLGWGTFSTVTEDDLMSSVLSKEELPEIEGLSKNLSPIETDMELWRRLVINSAYLFKSKTTRSCIEFLFKLIGAPKELMDIQEYIYVAESPINIEDNYNLPVDEEGFPKPINTEDIYFHMKGGWNSKREIAPNNSKNYTSVVGIHTGEYDQGNSYIDKFTEAGFILKRTVDNRKIWSKDDGNGYSDDIQDGRLAINSKEITTYLNPAKYIESEIIKWDNPAESEILLKLDEFYKTLIDPTTRKVISYNGGYPKLKKIVWEFFNDTDTKLTQEMVNKYIHQIDDFWVTLLEQFIPSTAIWEAGTIYRNTMFDRQKHTYKHGINFSSEFEKEVNAYPGIYVRPIEVTGEVNPPYELDMTTAIMDVEYLSTLEFPDYGDNLNNGSNILRIKNKIESNSKNLVIPIMWVEGASKIVDTALPEDYSTEVLYNGGEKIIKFLFEDITYSPTTNFQYKIFLYNEETKVFDKEEIVSGVIDASTINGGDITNHEGIDYKMVEETVTLREGEYLLKCGYNIEITFTPEEESIKEYYKKITEDGIDDLINLEDGKYMLNTLIMSDTNKYGIYNDNDFWFSIVEKPSTPLVKNLFEKSDFASARLVNEKLYVSAEGQKIFVLEAIPEGDIFFNINGSTLIRSLKRDYSDGGEYYLFREESAVQIILNEGVHIELDDTVTVIYLQANSDISFINTGIVKKGDPKLVLESNTGDKYIYSYEFDYSLLTDMSVEELIVVLNGSKLVKNDGYNNDYDYTINPDNERQLLLYLTDELTGDEVEEPDDEIIIYYPKPMEDGFYIDDRSVHVSWTSDNTTDEGLFTVEISEEDSTFTNILLSETEPYKPNANVGYTEYDVYVGDVTDPYKTFYYRIISDKKNIDLLGNEVVTRSVSNILTFKTDSSVQL